MGRFGVNMSVVDTHISSNHGVFTNPHDGVVRLRIHPIERLTNGVKTSNYKK